MKLKLLLLVLAMFGIGIALVGTNMSSEASVEDEYANYLEVARKKAEGDIPYLAVENYQAAFSIKNEDESIYIEYMEQAKKLGAQFYKSAIENYLIYYPNSAQAYETVCTYYYDAEKYDKVMEIALAANELGLATEQVEKYYFECAYSYSFIRTKIQEASSFVGGYALVKQDDLYGYIESSGGFKFTPKYEEASIIINASAAVRKDGEWYVMNSEGYKVAKPSKEVESLSFLNNGLLRVSVDGKYDFVTQQMNVPDELRFDYASNFKKGVAAVMKDGKWALLNSSNVFISDYVYEDIILDEYETCLNNGVIFAKSNGKYYMLNETGAKICETGFDDAYSFVGTGAAAVCVEGEWGFVDATGNMVIEPQYESAKSFNIGLGAVCKDGKWGYIDANNILRIECIFYDCLPFAANGTAAVKEEEYWSYIKLLPYK